MMSDYQELIRELNEKYPLVPHTGAGQLYSTLRRMKAEKEAGLPISLRTGFAISVEEGKPANELDESQWQRFFEQLCVDLREKYPEMYRRLFVEESI